MWSADHAAAAERGGRVEQEEWRRFSVRCDELIGQLEVPRPFTVEHLAEAVARRRGRHLRLIPLSGRDADGSGVCGIWIAFGEVDHVHYASGTSPAHQAHIILHELAHILLDHHQSGEPDLEGLRRLFPDLDPAMAARLLMRGRMGATTDQEQEAELLASLMWQHFATTPAALPRASRESVDALDLVMATFAGAYEWEHTDAAD